jgi:hypothetical protein
LARPPVGVEQRSAGTAGLGRRLRGRVGLAVSVRVRVNRLFFCLFARVRMMGLMLHGLLLGLTEAIRFFRFPFGSFGKIPNLLGLFGSQEPGTELSSFGFFRFGFR